jgi:restriction system protein
MFVAAGNGEFCMSVSTVPLLLAFMHPLLRVISSRPEGVRRRELFRPVADLMKLTTEQQMERLPSGSQLRYQHRIGWALNILKNGRYVEASSPGVWKITTRGRELLSRYQDTFDEGTIRYIVREAESATGIAATETTGDDVAATAQTPDERIDAALAELNGATAQELLLRIGQAAPSFFEELVLDLLRAMGYGSAEDAIERVGGTGDGGIDGIISLDRLGLEKVYVQAKRWQGAVGRPEVQAFYGALAGRRAKKGVFITTSAFTREAREFGLQVSEAIVLIDGTRLAALMIEHAVGVTHRAVRLSRIDSDYFGDS